MSEAGLEKQVLTEQRCVLWTNERLNIQTDGWSDGGIYKWTDRWKDRQSDGKTHGRSIVLLGQLMLQAFFKTYFGPTDQQTDRWT